MNDEGKKTRYPLPFARDQAHSLLRTLAPYCERIEIAGSIRRQAPTAGDIELVAIPRWEDGQPQRDMFGDRGPAPRVNALLAYLRSAGITTRDDDARYIRIGAHPIDEPITSLRLELDEPPAKLGMRIPVVTSISALSEPGNDALIGEQVDSIPVDLFLATPRNWGNILMIRTGSASFARAMLARWKAVSAGGFSRDGMLHRFVSPINTPEETDVFRLCEVPFVEPPYRVDELALVDALRRSAR